MTDFLKRPGPPHIRSWHIGHWQLIVAAHYDGDRYGFKGSDGWTFRVTVVRNP